MALRPADLQHLERTAPVPADALEAYRRDGHVVLRRWVAPDAMERIAHEVVPRVRRDWPRERPPPDRLDAYSAAFVQIVAVGEHDPVVRAFTHAPRIARAACELMGVPGVRLYCEDWLLKQPHGRHTPWHQDTCVMPFDAPATMTCWVPLTRITPGRGPLKVALRSNRLGLLSLENISEASDRVLGERVEREGLEIRTVDDLEPGDISFHDGLTVHGAGPNLEADERVVLALHLFADGAVMKEPQSDIMRHQHREFAADTRAGDPAVSARWPLLYRVAP
ncbi:MAG: phytanoyl-CoA dioxygenase family protein [Archangiaceae bacterium]|nr:phytanoyl-CoA dioxygenase family protein [Archangiaceae bacterium]